MALVLVREVVSEVGKTADFARTMRRASWSLLEVAEAGCRPVPFGILFVDEASDELTLRFRDSSAIAQTITQTGAELEEQDADILDFLAEDLLRKAREQGGAALLLSLEQSLSNFLRISDRTPIVYAGSPQRRTDRLFDDYVDSGVRPFVTHLPLFGLRAAATKFGEGMAAQEEGWIRVPEQLRLKPGMFVAHVVGRSMEPLIPDNSLCVFRANVTGTRQGKNLLIEKFGESDFASRYTVKRYTSTKVRTESGWEHGRVRLEPLNPEFEAFDLGPDEFSVIAELVEVLGPE